MAWALSRARSGRIPERLRLRREKETVSVLSNVPIRMRMSSRMAAHGRSEAEVGDSEGAADAGACMEQRRSTPTTAATGIALRTGCTNAASYTSMPSLRWVPRPSPGALVKRRSRRR